MKIIGITGKSGSGKTTFASLLAKKLNCEHIDIDKIGHQALYEPEILSRLCDTFGNNILDETGHLDRKKLGNIVFTKKEKMDELTDITWEYMQQQLDLILSQNHDFIILDWILLPNTKYFEKCDFNILISSNDIQRKNKILERDNISEEYFEKRDSASIDYSPFNFDFKFENNYDNETINAVILNINNQLIGGKKIWN